MRSNATLNNIKKRQGELYDLSMAILDWLNYLKRVSAGDIIEEASLKYPITEYLERKGKYICAQQVNHPVFQRKRLDIAWGKSRPKPDEEGDEKWSNYIELKYAKHVNIRNVTDDLFRLYFVKKKHPRSHCYFLLFGEKVLFNANFQRTIIEKEVVLKGPNGLTDKQEIEFKGESEQQFAHWFTLQPAEPLKKIRCNEQKTDSLYSDFLSRKKGSYIFRDEKFKKIKITFQTRLTQRCSNTNAPAEFCVVIWEILLK